MNSETMYYGGYLHLDKILDAQYPKSFEEGNQPAHDEMLFIIIHQAYELWFKQILFELDYIMSVFGKEKINDNSEDLNLVLHRLKRITKIMELLNQQVTILDTMTPLDFLEFRNLLTPSSGFQSVQFRLIEARLGLKMENRHHKDYYKRTNEGGFNIEDYQKINSVEEKPTLATMVNDWLERMPFFDADLWKDFSPKFLNKEKLHPFWNEYRSIYLNGLSEREKSKLADFDYTFFEIIPEGLTEEEKARFAQLNGLF
ncbi:MAG TPA: tryptophan 2,3-dioxygenase family protein, partial [Parasegetibacter sp.]